MSGNFVWNNRPNAGLPTIAGLSPGWSGYHPVRRESARPMIGPAPASWVGTEQARAPAPIAGPSMVGPSMADPASTILPVEAVVGPKVHPAASQDTRQMQACQGN